jgi:SAM-dependent methyltransferase
MTPGTAKWRLGLAEHLVRYQRAAEVVQNKRVLDIGCGVGYGSHHMAEAGAAEVLGLDRSQEAVAYAKREFIHPCLDFTATELDQLELGLRRFDVITAFEIIEHLPSPESLPAKAASLLEPQGVFFVSTPNSLLRPKNPDGTPRNPFHTREFTAQEFQDILEAHFSEVSILGQCLHASYRRLESAFLLLQRESATGVGQLWSNPLVRVGRWLQTVRGRCVEPQVPLHPFPPQMEDYIWMDRELEKAPYFLGICRLPLNSLNRVATP